MIGKQEEYVRVHVNQNGERKGGCKENPEMWARVYGRRQYIVTSRQFHGPCNRVHEIRALCLCGAKNISCPAARSKWVGETPNNG